MACFIFDRNIDMITPLCTTYVYEGILDDYIGIDFNSISVNTKILEKEASNPCGIKVVSKLKWKSRVIAKNPRREKYKISFCMPKKPAFWTKSALTKA